MDREPSKGSRGPSLRQLADGSCYWPPLGRDYAPGFPRLGWASRSPFLALRPQDNFLLHDTDDYFGDKCRLAPEIQGRRTGPVQKGEPPARLNRTTKQPTSPPNLQKQSGGNRHTSFLASSHSHQRGLKPFPPVETLSYGDSTTEWQPSDP